MRPLVLRLVLDVVLTTAVALVLLTVWFLLRTDAGAGEGARVLFNFMDVGLAIWIVVSVVLLVKTRALSTRRMWATLVLGVVLNGIVVFVVGLIQGGPSLLLFAVEAEIACVIAAAIVIPIVHRLVRSSPPS